MVIDSVKQESESVNGVSTTVIMTHWYARSAGKLKTDPVDDAKPVHCQCFSATWSVLDFPFIFGSPTLSYARRTA